MKHMTIVENSLGDFQNRFKIINVQSLSTKRWMWRKNNVLFHILYPLNVLDNLFMSMSPSV